LARQTIVTAAALSAFFDPASMQPAASFQTVEQRVKRSYVKTYRSSRALLDELADFVAVARTRFDERKDKQFGATFLPFHLLGCSLHIWQRNILNDGAGSGVKGMFRELQLSLRVGRFRMIVNRVLQRFARSARLDSTAMLKMPGRLDQKNCLKTGVHSIKDTFN